MNGNVVKKIRALPLLLAFLCLAACSSARQEDCAPPPVQGAAAERKAPLQEKAARGIPERQEEQAAPVESPKPQARPSAPAAAARPADEEVVTVIDDVVITRQEFIQAKTEVEVVVDDLNKITRERDYPRWVAYLEPSYRETLSDLAYLDQISDSLPKVLKDRRIRLTTLMDYFEYVFVPSRQNIRVDDIRYITPTRVYVIMFLPTGQRAAVYILERESEGIWKLADKN